MSFVSKFVADFNAVDPMRLLHAERDQMPDVMKWPGLRNLLLGTSPSALNRSGLRARIFAAHGRLAETNHLARSAIWCGMSGFHVRRDKAALFQWVQGPPGDSLPPEATGAGMEVTKCLKPSDNGHGFGDCASVQAAT